MESKRGINMNDEIIEHHLPKSKLGFSWILDF